MATIDVIVNEALTEDKLVELWQEYLCLYVVQSAEFKNRDLRQQAVEEIAEKLEQSVDWVKNKLRQLRNSFTKAKKAPSSGSARKATTKRTAWLLEKLQFLEPYIATRQTVSNLNAPSPAASATDGESVGYNAEDSHFDTEDDLSFSQDEENEGSVPSSTPSSKKPTQIRPKSVKRKREEEEYELIKGLANSIAKVNSNIQPTSTADEVDTLGQYIVQSLRKLEPKVRVLTQHNFQTLLFQAQMGMHQTQTGVNPTPMFPQVYPQSYQSTHTVSHTYPRPPQQNLPHQNLPLQGFSQQTSDHTYKDSQHDQQHPIVHSAPFLTDL